MDFQAMMLKKNKIIAAEIGKANNRINCFHINKEIEKENL
jgi:hypothetical protein